MAFRHHTSPELLAGDAPEQLLVGLQRLGIPENVIRSERLAAAAAAGDVSAPSVFGAAACCCCSRSLLPAACCLLPL
jgi:hypothetical protein